MGSEGGMAAEPGSCETLYARRGERARRPPVRVGAASSCPWPLAGCSEPSLCDRQCPWGWSAPGSPWGLVGLPAGCRAALAALLAEVPAGVFVPASSSSLAGTHGAAVAWQDGTGRPCPPGTCRRVARHTRQGPGRAGPWASSGGRADRGAALQTGSTSRGRGRGRPRCCPCST